MRITFDVLQAVFWCITYVLVIIYGYKYKTTGIPIIAVASNFAWEAIAFLRDITIHGTIGIIHVAWFSLDLIIVLLYLFRCRELYFKKWVFVLIWVVELFIFYHIFNLSSGMLLLCFCIDLFMAAEWLLYVFSKAFVPNRLSISFCAAKLLGDLFAWLFYREYYTFVDIVGILVLLLNAVCLFVVIKKFLFSRRVSQENAGI